MFSMLIAAAVALTAVFGVHPGHAKAATPGHHTPVTTFDGGTGSNSGSGGDISGGGPPG